MAIFIQRQHHLTSILLCLSLLLIRTMCKASPAAAKGGFRLKLIHRYYSPESPFYNPNISTIELHNRQVESDRARLQYFLSKTKSPMAIQPDDELQPRPPLYEHEFTYSVKLHIGQGSGGRREFRLALDTGSGLTWVQCEPCVRCFSTLHPKFVPKLSHTYRSFRCDNQFFQPPEYFCDHRYNSQMFHYVYGDRTYADGIMAHDIFGFDTDQGAGVQMEYDGVVFGCAHKVTASYPFLGAEGILGLNMDTESFINRIRTDNNIRGQFSYCFADAGSPRHGYLRFGPDIPQLPQGYQWTSIIEYRDPPHNYYLNLRGISIGDHWMVEINQGVFNRYQGAGGVIIDSGSGNSLLTTFAFNEVLKYLRSYFAKRRLKELKCSELGVDSALCYCLPPNWRTIQPEMTWHFQGADFRVLNTRLFTNDFRFDHGFFYLTLGDGKGMTLIGVDHQINNRFIYDLARSRLEFVWEDCSIDP